MLELLKHVGINAIGRTKLGSATSSLGRLPVPGPAGLEVRVERAILHRKAIEQSTGSGFFTTIDAAAAALSPPRGLVRCHELPWGRGGDGWQTAGLLPPPSPPPRRVLLLRCRP